MKLIEIETEKPRYIVAELQDHYNTTEIVGDIKSSFNLLQKKYNAKVDILDTGLKSNIEYTDKGIKGNIKFKYSGKTLINYPKNGLPKYLLFTIYDHKIKDISALDSLDGFTEKEAN